MGYQIKAHANFVLYAYEMIQIKMSLYNIRPTLGPRFNRNLIVVDSTIVFRRSIVSSIPYATIIRYMSILSSRFQCYNWPIGRECGKNDSLRWLGIGNDLLPLFS